MSPSSPAGSSSSLPDSAALLAIPDGPIPSDSSDLASYTVSRIGGYPCFPCPIGAQPTPTCGSCKEPIPLLAQVYCPPEDGENDRTLYVFACGRVKCQRQKGAVRAWRASRRNEEYVRDVEEKRKVREEEERKAREEARKNPFTMSGDANGESLFGAPTGLFGSAPSNPFSSPALTTPTPDITALSIEPATSTSLSSPHPAYWPAQYLSTTDEYLPPPDDVEYDSDDDKDESAEQKAEWRDERFQQMLTKGIDPLFERFVRRLEDAEGAAEQVLRYELNGVPLPYSVSSPLTSTLFPGLVAACKAQKAEDEDPSPASFFEPPKSLIPACETCKGKRVFELQLVPSLINILRPHTLSTTGADADAPDRGEGKKSTAQMTEKERKEELEKIAKGEVDEGMEWGSILVFSCERDCVGVREEWVGVEWEAMLGAGQ